MRSKVDGKVNLLTGETSLCTDEYQWITPQKNTDGSLEAVIYPQEAAPYREGDGLLKIISQGKESFFKAPEIVSGGTVLSDFEAGKQVTIRLSLKESDARWANKKVWVHGITAPMIKNGNRYLLCIPLPPWCGRKSTAGTIVTS